MERRLEEARARLSASRVEKRYDADVWFDVRPSRRKVLARMDAARLQLGGGRLLAVPCLGIGNTDHIGLAGDNASGKTTLVKHLVEGLPQGTKTLYIPQEPTSGQVRAALGALEALDNEELGRALSVMAQLNARPACVLEGGDVSPGELRKLMLALGVLASPEIVIMDEPTNHLDMGSIEALERMLAAYPGALLLVSHDESLVKAVSNTTWLISRRADGFDEYELTVC